VLDGNPCDESVIISSYLEGCLNFISHFPSDKRVTSLAMMSISFAAVSPSRFERTARMSGAMPLFFFLEFFFFFIAGLREKVCVVNSPRNNDNGYIITLAPGIEFLEARIELDVYPWRGENI